MDASVYDIWLSLALTPDTQTFACLLGEFSDSESIYNASEERITALTDHRSSDRDRLLDKDLTRAREVLDFCREKGVGILTYFDDAFPESLRNIPTPPVLLYYRGILPDFKRCFAVGVVGTRSVSSYGRKNAYNIAYDLAYAGATVVSGMALGIDGVALAGALGAGGVTVAVIGSGIDICYPMQHRTLAREIVKHGCVFTEYAPGTRPERYNFPRRNRLISGLSAATVVIEGSEKSGSLLTARHAMKQGRAVYALPGNVESRNSEVCNLLLRNGARALTCADDVIRDFETEYSGILNPFKLSVSERANMDETLRRYCVSAVSPDDEIFTAKRSRKKNEERRPETVAEVFSASKHDISENAERMPSESAEDRTPTGFDARTLRIYKKIPTKGSCLIESLVDSEFTLRDVMKALLKLEMGMFVKILPGEHVARNL